MEINETYNQASEKVRKSDTGDRSNGVTDVKFLAESVNRVRVLELLATAPRDRHELQAAAEISEATVKRILRGLEERGWAIREGARYRATPVGAFVVSVFNRTHDNLTTLGELREIQHFLPTDEMSVDLRCFRDATITLPTQDDPWIVLRRGLDVLESADSVLLVSNSAAPDQNNAPWRATVHNGQQHRAVVTTNVVEINRHADAESVTKFTEILRAENAEIRQYDGEIPYFVGIADGTALLGVTDDHSAICALVESEDPLVRAWTESVFDTYFRASEPIDLSLFPSVE